MLCSALAVNRTYPQLNFRQGDGPLLKQRLHLRLRDTFSIAVATRSVCRAEDLARARKFAQALHVGALHLDASRVPVEIVRLNVRANRSWKSDAQTRRLDTVRVRDCSRQMPELLDSLRSQIPKAHLVEHIDEG